MSEKFKVVLVDDDEEDYLLTADMLSELSRQPYELEWISNPDDARARLASQGVDICLLDYRLGPEDGISLIPEIREGGFTGPIIMLTGQRDRDLEDAALAAGAVDYLSKQDVDAYELERALRYALMRRQAETHERERLEADALRREAEAANQAKSEFLAYISHELRTPLSALLSYADLLALSITDVGMAEYTSAIARNGRHLQALLDDMLDLSLIESAKLELDMQDTEVSQLVGNIVATAQVQCQTKGLGFVLDLPDQLPVQLVTDKKRLTQMLFNLLGNAIKFTDTGSVTFRVAHDSQASELRFEVEDTGPGISEQDRERIFEPFQRINSSSGQGGGVGLGLTITARLAEALEARLELRSTPGMGTCFSLIVPANPASPMQKVVRSDLLQPGIAASIPGNLEGVIVVVDDAEDVRKSVSGLLGKLGAQVRALGSGTELLGLYEKNAIAPDLILLDMQMPEVDGYEVARQLRAQGIEIPIIALTAAVFEGAREACLAAGCDDYLSKPVEPARLFGKISAWLSGQGESPGQLEDSTGPEAGATMQAPSTTSGQEVVDVLIVDDARDARDAMRDLLQMQGLAVRTAASEPEAMESMESSPPRSLLLDINLEVGDGISLARFIRADSRFESTRIIGLTGRAQAEFTVDERALFDAFMIKPIRISVVLETLADCGIRPA